MDTSPFPKQTDMNGGKAVGSIDRAASSLKDSIDSLNDPAKDMVNRASTTAHATVDRLAETASRVAGKFSEKTHNLSGVPTKALEYSKTKVQDYPLYAIGASLFLGYVLGRLNSASRSRYTDRSDY